MTRKTHLKTSQKTHEDVLIYGKSQQTSTQNKNENGGIFQLNRHVIVYRRVSETQPFHLPKIQCRIARSARAIELVDGGA